MSAAVLIPDPPAMASCDVCDLSVDDGDIDRVSRCSACKNRFYCSAKCQKGDWKTHKFDCSPLNVSASSLDAATLEENRAEIERASTVLKEWLAAVKRSDEVDKKAKIAVLPESKALRALTLAKPLDYTRPSLQADVYPFRAPITALTRLFLTDLVLHMTPEHRTAFAEQLSGWSMPSSFPSVYAPKVVAHPADLSPGEYGMVGTCMPVYFMTGAAWADKRVEDEWLALALAQKRLWNVRGAVQSNLA